MSNRKKPKGTNRLRSYAKYSGLAFQLMAIIFVGVFTGVKLDAWLDNKFPSFTIGLSLLAFFAMMYFLIKKLPRT
ncbi:MAG: AtpZ/AtpI family protein [Cyclobacteriaceae bacterium]